MVIYYVPESMDEESQMLCCCLHGWRNVWRFSKSKVATVRREKKTMIGGEKTQECCSTTSTAKLTLIKIVHCK